MKFTLESPTALTIRSVTRDEIRIGDHRWTQTIALTTETVLKDWEHKAIESLQFDDFAMLLDTSPEIIVLGTGTKPLIPARELVFAMARSGVGFEVMDTAAAARTFNVLVSEGRQIAAVLYL